MNTLLYLIDLIDRNQLFVLAEVLAGCVSMVCSVMAFAAMSWSTRHCYRFVYLAIGLSGMCLTFGPLFPEDHERLVPYARALFMLAFSVYMVLDRRRITHTRAPAAAPVAAPKPADPAGDDPDRTVPNGMGPGATA